MNNKIYTDKAPAAIGPYSQAVQAGNILYISGMIPVDPATNAMAGSTIEEQASQIMRNIDAVLKEAGYSVDDVVKTTCFLADMNDFTRFNEVYADFFTSKPARSCVAVKQLPKGALAEVETIAIKA
ncbi:RidA family protein [Galactobacillus timonensis]|uniref:RidA family protein n=1 Tax=Galactobacillus timonensis TaxID=2041840 RepID=UPI000C8161B7|nr:RidA family protein [Galactobacillus timonensis]